MLNSAGPFPAPQPEVAVNGYEHELVVIEGSAGRPGWMPVSHRQEADVPSWAQVALLFVAAALIVFVAFAVWVLASAPAVHR